MTTIENGKAVSEVLDVYRNRIVRRKSPTEIQLEIWMQGGSPVDSDEVEHWYWKYIGIHTTGKLVVEALVNSVRSLTR